jgi:ubiquinone/menaquinone biosynthesis C-methylase UbiE
MKKILFKDSKHLFILSSIIGVAAFLSYQYYKRWSANNISDMEFKPTANKMGFMLPAFTWASSEFLKDIQDLSSPNIFVIAAGWGFMAKKALKANKSGQVTANDLSTEHLNVLKSQVSVFDKPRLTLLPGDILKENLQKNHHDAVLVRNVLHFFDGGQVDQLLEKIHSCLKPGGKVYIVTGSPYVNLVKMTNTLKIVEEKKKQGEKWPGFLGNFSAMVAEKNPTLAEKLPQQMHLMHLETLQTALKKKGFEVERIGYHAAPKFTGPAKAAAGLIVLDGREYLAAIAEKPQVVGSFGP